MKMDIKKHAIYNGSSFVYRIIETVANSATIDSVIGMVSQRQLSFINGRINIKIPLTTSPLATETMNEALGFSSA